MSSLFLCPSCGESGTPGSLCPKDQTKIPFPILMKGFRAGEYTGLEKIGEGGMGEVWRGEQPLIQKKVAIKILNEKVAQSADLVARFQREALAVNKIESQHIVDIFSLGKLEDGRPYMVMEFLQGQSLQKNFDRTGPMPFSEIIFFMGQICKGLQAAHDANIVHRDLKPDNIFLSKDKGEKLFVKILDFGIAKLLDAELVDQVKLTGTNATFGTPAYMSPQQLKAASDVDHRADLYSLGIILFEMITGRTPFYEGVEPPITVMMRHVTKEPPSASSMVTGRAVPPSVDKFLKKALAKKVEPRPQSAMEFFEQLVEAVGDAKNPEVDILTNPEPVWTSDLARERQKRKKKSETPVPPAAPEQSPAKETKEVRHEVLERAHALTENASLPSVEVPTLPEHSSWFRWLGAGVLSASVVAGLFFFIFQPGPPHQEPVVTPQSQPLASQPSTSTPVTIIEPATQAAPASIPTSVPASIPASAPVSMSTSTTVPAVASVPNKLNVKAEPKEKNNPANTKEQPKEVTAVDPPKETPKEDPTKEPPKEEPKGPKETANPFDNKPKETANPFGQKKP